jgi:hypothetical protein
MAAQEGFRRIRLIGKAILIIGLSLLGIAILGYILEAIFHLHFFVLEFAPLGFLLSAIAAAILLAAWVGEGFCEPRHPPHG